MMGVVRRGAKRKEDGESGEGEENKERRLNVEKHGQRKMEAANTFTQWIK